jgi:light-regulated signal transduction histidine kinase (bacteriophytochrome)
LNRSLARKDKELKEKNAEILLFSHVTGHDLKEPLRRIYSFIELISSKESENLSGEGRSYLKRIQISVQRMGLLTDDLLNYSLLGKDRSEEISDLNLHSLLRFARNNLKEIIEEKNAIIESTALPVIKGYRTLIVDLLQHLLSNSLKFQKNDVAPHIFITTAILNGKEINDPDALADKNYLRVSVEDNGMGFEQKDAERIFQMFQRLNDKNAYPGTGIGLALCRKIMQLHNGFISAESEVGKGSIFHCYFPGSQ